jgi:hypothetical protein
MHSPTRPVSARLVKNSRRSKGVTWRGCKNEDRCYTSERAHKSIQPVTYPKHNPHTFANAPGLDMFGPESVEIEGGDLGGVQKRRSVLHVRTSPQINITCYIPSIHLPYAPQRARSRHVWSRIHRDQVGDRWGLQKREISTIRMKEQVNG